MLGNEESVVGGRWWVQLERTVGKVSFEDWSQILKKKQKKLKFGKD